MDMLGYKEKMYLKVFDYAFKSVGEYDEVLLVKYESEPRRRGGRSTSFNVFGSRFSEKSTSHKIWLRSLNSPPTPASYLGSIPKCKPLILTLSNAGIVDHLPSMTIPQQYLAPNLSVKVLPISKEFAVDGKPAEEWEKVAVERAKIELGCQILAEILWFNDLGFCMEEGYRGGRTLLTHRAGASKEELFLKIDLEG
jgi:hypothetical protein